MSSHLDDLPGALLPGGHHLPQHVAAQHRHHAAHRVQDGALGHGAWRTAWSSGGQPGGQAAS